MKLQVVSTVFVLRDPSASTPGKPSEDVGKGTLMRERTITDYHYSHL